jgi:hypothetical protein
MSDYVYDPSKMEALYAILNDEDGDYGYSVNWKTKHVKIEGEAFKWETIEDPTHDTFEYDGISFWWYHAKNKDAKHPVLVASWSVQKREDDFDEYEEEIDADIESIIDLIKSTGTGHYYER